MYLSDHYSRDLKFVRGEGCFLFDKKGIKYIDFLAGWCVANVGYGRKEIITALQTAARNGLYVPPFFRDDAWENFAKKLCSIAPNKKLNKAFRLLCVLRGRNL